MLFYLPIALTALATTLYHIAQKSIVPGGVTFVRSIKELNWATYVVGLLAMLMCLGGLVLIARP